MSVISPKSIRKIFFSLFVTITGGVIVCCLAPDSPSPSIHFTDNSSVINTPSDTCCYTEVPPKGIPIVDEIKPPTQKPRTRKVMPTIAKTQSIPVIVSEAKFEAKIYVNDRWELNAPNTIELPYGTHTIKVKTDTETYETKIKIPTDRTQILIEDHYFKAD